MTLWIYFIMLFASLSLEYVILGKPLVYLPRLRTDSYRCYGGRARLIDIRSRSFRLRFTTDGQAASLRNRVA